MNFYKEPHLYIFTGHFGSGKTETAVNFAFELKKSKPDSKVALLDLDIINPFFRSADAKEKLEKAGITVEIPLYANTNVDVPALTGKMGAIIGNLEYDVVLDIGGDDLGARAVGYYSDIIKNRAHTIYFVANSFRPFTSTIEAATKIFEEVEASTALKISGIVNNSNLLEHTTAQTVLDGLPLIENLARSKNVPVLMHAAMRPVAEELLKLRPDDNILPMDVYVKLLFARE